MGDGSGVTGLMQNNRCKEMQPLLLIHGIISDGSFFDKIKEELCDEFEVFTYDRIGYGNSSFDYKEAKDEYTVSSQADQAYNVIKDLRRPAWIVGNSAGGLIAIELALKYPNAVAGMILLEPSLAFDEKTTDELIEWNRLLNSFKNEKRIKKALPAFSEVIGNTDNHEPTSLLEMKKTYKNLENFMYGELNDIQNYRPSLSQLKQIDFPVYIGISQDGAGSIFARSSIESSYKIEWPIVYFPGYHNTLKDYPKEGAAIIKNIIMDKE